MGHSYFKFTVKQTDKVTVYMVRQDKVCEFYSKVIDYVLGDCSITIKGRYTTNKDSRKWFVLPPTINSKQNEKN